MKETPIVAYTAYHGSLAILRAYYQAEPQAVQRETLGRVARLIAERPQSYLARHWRAIYVSRGLT